MFVLVRIAYLPSKGAIIRKGSGYVPAPDADGVQVSLNEPLCSLGFTKITDRHRKPNEVLVVYGESDDGVYLVYSPTSALFGIYDDVEGQLERLVLSQERLSPEQEMVQDLMSIVHCFSSLLYGLRNYRRELKKAIASDADPESQNTTEA